MRKGKLPKCGRRAAFVALGLGWALSLTGCQIDVGGQTLPSPWYQNDDIQYFPPGPEYILSEEAAQQKAYAGSHPAAPEQQRPQPEQ